jgi:hypothetical protein
MRLSPLRTRGYTSDLSLWIYSLLLEEENLIELAYFGGLSQREMSERTGVPWAPSRAEPLAPSGACAGSLRSGILRGDRTMKCTEIQANLAAFVVGGLEPKEATEVGRHLSPCPGCQDEQRKPRSCSTSHPRPESTTPCSSPRSMSMSVLLRTKRWPSRERYRTPTTCEPRPARAHQSL